MTSTAPAPPYRETVLADAPRGYWRLGEASGTTAADEALRRAPGPTRGDPARAQRRGRARGPEHGGRARRRGRHHPDPQLRQPEPHLRAALEVWIRPAALPSTSATLMRKDLQYLLRLTSGGESDLPAVAGRRVHRAVDRRRRLVSRRLEPRRGHLRRHAMRDLRERHGARHAGPLARGQLRQSAHARGRAATTTGSPAALTSRPSSAPRFPRPAVQAHYAKASPAYRPAADGGARVARSGTTRTAARVFARQRGPERRRSVTVKVDGGNAATGTPVQTPRRARCSRRGRLLGRPLDHARVGTYTARAEQATTAGFTGRSPPVTFTVRRERRTARSPPPATSRTAAGATTRPPPTCSTRSPAPCSRWATTPTSTGPRRLPLLQRQLGPPPGPHPPIPGDHDYGDSDAVRLLRLLRRRRRPAPAGYYSYDLGTWHVVALNTAATSSCAPATPPRRSGSTTISSRTAPAARSRSVHEPRSAPARSTATRQRAAALADPLRPRSGRGPQRQRAPLRALRAPDARGRERPRSRDPPVHRRHRRREPLPGRRASSRTARCARATPSASSR